MSFYLLMTLSGSRMKAAEGIGSARVVFSRFTLPNGHPAERLRFSVRQQTYIFMNDYDFECLSRHRDDELKPVMFRKLP